MSEEKGLENYSNDVASGHADGAGRGMASNRRLMLKGSLATMAALGTGMVSGLAKASMLDGAFNDIDILNFALNLEYLEANYYLLATTGHSLAANQTSGSGRLGDVDGGHMVPFKNDAVRQFAEEIAGDEKSHVDFLRAALGSSKVAQPEINLKRSFQQLGQAAGLGNDFDPFESEDNFIIGAYVFEDVGVTAYHGAAPYIQEKSYLDAAAGILAVEAYHAGIIRTLMYQLGFFTQAAAISHLRQQLSMTKHKTDEGIILHGKANLVPANGNAIAFQRTPAEVLNIVYEGGQSADFGFFPKKVNGAIR